jgi:UDP-2,3-diacylglucosamine hydrolase
MAELHAAELSSPAAASEGPLALICGGGTLPAAVAQAVVRGGRRVVLFPIRGWADPALVETYPHCWLAVAQVGRFLRRAKEEGCRDVAFIGTAVRPPFRALRVDWEMLKLLPRVWRIYRGGDDHLLSGVLRIFEDGGFRIVGAHEVAPQILMPAGNVGSRMPTPQDLADIEHGLGLLRAIGPFDVGQGAVVANNHVLAVEAAEGTDAMLARVAELRTRGRIPTPPGKGVLVKAPKPDQDRRIDLPTIGPRTVAEAARAGLAGIAVMAGEAIIAEPDAVAAAADREKVFVFGIGTPQ